MEVLKSINRTLALPLLSLVVVYQKTLSPDHGLIQPFYPHGFCKFYPSCSMYARTVLRRRGLTGIYKIIKRVLSCNPLAAGGIDHP